MKQRPHSFALLCLGLWVAFAMPARAQSLLYDAEIENTLRVLTTPILDAAELSTEDVKLFIVNDDRINAFVAGGLNIFIHTGLILRAENPDMLTSVIAHEVGHIAGAHLTQLRSASTQASIGALVGYILGAAAVVGGSADAGAAIMSGSQNVAMRNLFSHYRGNEQQADQAAIKYLKQINYPLDGMLEMFELLRRNERQYTTSNDPYMRTHPLTSERIAAVRNAVEAAKQTAPSIPMEHQVHYQRMRAKLFAFLETPEKALAHYPESDTSEAGYLARAVAYFRQPDLKKSLANIDALLEMRPEDPYAYDMKGQILFEHGRIDDAIKAYETANELAPNTAIILTDLGKAYLAKETPENTQKALSVLQHATTLGGIHARGFRYLGQAYALSGKEGRSQLALAHGSFLRNNPKDALKYAKRAKKLLSDDATALIAAEEVITDAERLIKEQKDAKSLF